MKKLYYIVMQFYGLDGRSVTIQKQLNDDARPDLAVRPVRLWPYHF